MTEHIANLVSRQDLRDEAEAEIRRLALELDLIGEFDPYLYVPPGPVAQAFLNSSALTSVIMGPLGGGKTTACTFKRIATAAQAPIARHPEDGRPTRMCRGIVLRDTFRSAEKTVLESWKQWFPKGYPGSDAQGGNDRPFMHRLRFRGADGIRVEAITEFAGLNEQSIETMMKGREYSFGWLNELDTHAEGALDDIEQRLGRYPRADLILGAREIAQLEQQLGHRIHQPETRQRVAVGDMNAPTIDNWTYEALVTDRSPDRAFFQQPSGLSEDAENIFNLEPDYYQRIVANQEQHFVHRMVHNRFGFSRAGKPVHPSFDSARHIAHAELAADPNLDLNIGIDVSTGGLSPAAMFGQVAVRIRFLEELFEGTGVGPARFGQALQRVMQERFPNFEKRRVKLWFDPAAAFGGDKEAGELNAMETIASIMGLPYMIAGDGSNALTLRLGAVDTELRGYHEPDSHLLISPRCKLYIAALGGRYRFRKKPESASNEYDDLPEKSHPWSDIADAGQYDILGMRGTAAVRRAISGGDRQAGEGNGWRSQVRGGTVSRGFDVHRVGKW